MDTKTLMEWSAKYHTPELRAGRRSCWCGARARACGTRDGREYLDFTAGIAVTVARATAIR